MITFPKNRTNSPAPTHPKQGFTLIELLVVIAIIAILMGLLFPAANGALNSAKKTTAKNQAVQIATAITAYETEYSRLPSNSGSNVGSSLVNMLCTTNDPINNPRALVFLEASGWKSGKGGTNNKGFCDPFTATSVYFVALDTNYSNVLSNLPSQASGGGAPQYTNVLAKHVGVWTVFTNGSKYYLINSWD